MADRAAKADRVGTEVLQLSHDLHPPMLKTLLAVGPLRVYCEGFSRFRNIPFACHADDSVQYLSRGAALACIARSGIMGMRSRTARPQHVDGAPGAARTARGAHGERHGRVSIRIDSVAWRPGLINCRASPSVCNATFERHIEPPPPGRGTTVAVPDSVSTSV